MYSRVIEEEGGLIVAGNIAVADLFHVPTQVLPWIGTGAVEAVTFIREVVAVEAAIALP